MSETQTTRAMLELQYAKCEFQLLKHRTPKQKAEALVNSISKFTSIIKTKK